jgi:transposase
MTDQEMTTFFINFDSLSKEFKVLSGDVRDLIIVLKGYNGFPGFIKEFTDLKEEFWNYVDLRKDSPSNKDIKELMDLMKSEVKAEREISSQACRDNLIEIDKVKKEIITLQNKPGRIALKWLGIVTIAIVSAAAAAFFGLWLENRKVILNYVKSNPIQIIVPSSTINP